MKSSLNNIGSEVFRRNLLAAALLTAFATPGVFAATITVDPTAADAAVAGDGMCSLREAVLSVNAGAPEADCVAVTVTTEAFGTNDTINLPAGTYTLTLAGLDETSAAGAPPTVVNLPDATVGDLDLLKSVKIVGAGSGTTKIQWDPAATSSAGADRIFHAYTTDLATLNVAVVIQGVTLANGKTFQVDLGVGPASGSGSEPTNYYLRRAGGALAVGPAAAVVLIDPNVTDQENSEGRGGSQKPIPGSETGGATYTLTLSDVIVESNNAQGDGGGIYTAAAMTATNTIVRNNTALTNGGGVYNEGATSVIASTVSGNKAEGGGGFFGTGSNTVRFDGVTLSGNTAVGGGGISGRSGVTMNIVNSTISGNIGSDVGGGLYTNGSANLNFVTIARNLSGADSPDAGSGINLFPASSANILTLKNVLIEGNKKGWTELLDAAAIAALPTANCGRTGGGVDVTSLGSNLSSDASCDTWLTATTDKKSVDPKLDVLADNGGPTLTHKLLAGSPAMAAGTADAAVTVDQRGFARDAVPDIGAYEDPAPVVPPGTTVPGTLPSVDTSSSSGGGGGCTVSPHADFDAGLLGLLAAAASGLFLRRRREGKTQ